MRIYNTNVFWNLIKAEQWILENDSKCDDSIWVTDSNRGVNIWLSGSNLGVSNSVTHVLEVSVIDLEIYFSD